jgi:acetyl esterase/lipase
MHVDPALYLPTAVDAATRQANAALEKLLAEAPAIQEQDPREIRAARARGDSMWGPIVHVPEAEMRSIPGPDREIPLRIFRPDLDVCGIYFHIHGGGWTLGAADGQDPMLQALSRAARVVVVSVDYRLAPEHPYPAGPDDCEAAALWLLAKGTREFGSERVVIGGESAGAHLSAVTALRLRDRHGEAPFCGANLVYGAYDLTLTPSVRNWGERNLVLSTPIIEWFTDHFVPEAGLRGHPDVSPLFADLSGLPSALFSVGTLDPLLDDSLFMAQRWEAAGSPAEVALYPGGVHGFNLFPIPLAQRAARRCEQFVADTLEGAS